MTASIALIKQLILAATLALLAACTSDPLPSTGSWRVVNYWAVWCTPCREEIPELNTLSVYNNVNVLGVNYDGKQGDALQAQAETLGIEFALLANDPSQDLGTPRPQVLPTTLIVAPDGRLLKTLVGPQTAQALLTVLHELGYRE